MALILIGFLSEVTSVDDFYIRNLIITLNQLQFKVHYEK